MDRVNGQPWFPASSEHVVGMEVLVDQNLITLRTGKTRQQLERMIE